MHKKKIDSTELKINLASGKEGEIFKWFLAALLFGKPVQQEVARRTYFEFKKAKILSPEKIVEAGWNRLVKILDEGHYVRYDFSTGTKLIDISKEIVDKYGSIGELLRQSKNREDLKQKLMELKGVGPVTARIFMRDLEKYLPKDIFRS